MARGNLTLCVGEENSLGDHIVNAFTPSETFLPKKDIRSGDTGPPLTYSNQNSCYEKLKNKINIKNFLQVCVINVCMIILNITNHFIIFKITKFCKYRER